jgi:hypothetical protein
MNKYKIDPEIVNIYREKYPELKIVFLIDNEASDIVYETKATSLKIDFKNKKYLINFYVNHENQKTYEVSEDVGIMLVNRGYYPVLAQALDRIIEL